MPRQAQAQQGGDALTFDDIRARFEQQQQEIRQLQDQLRSAQQGPQVDYGRRRKATAAKKPADDAEEGGRQATRSAAT